LKEPGSRAGSFNLAGGEEKSPYEVNCIIYRQNLLGANSTPFIRAHNVFYEPFLRSHIYTFFTIALSLVYRTAFLV